jgi:hypothetical protein
VAPLQRFVAHWAATTCHSAGSAAKLAQPVTELLGTGSLSAARSQPTGPRDTVEAALAAAPVGRINAALQQLVSQRDGRTSAPLLGAAASVAAALLGCVAAAVHTTGVLCGLMLGVSVATPKFIYSGLAHLLGNGFDSLPTRWPRATTASPADREQEALICRLKNIEAAFPSESVLNAWFNDLPHAHCSAHTKSPCSPPAPISLPQLRHWGHRMQKELNVRAVRSCRNALIKAQYLPSASPAVLAPLRHVLTRLIGPFANRSQALALLAQRRQVAISAGYAPAFDQPELSVPTKLADIAQEIIDLLQEFDTFLNRQEGSAKALCSPPGLSS